MSIRSTIGRAIPSGLKSGVRRILAPPRARQWHFDSAQLPWFDQPDALERLRTRKDVPSDEDRRHLTKWVNDGYFVVPGLISGDLIDSMQKDVDQLWTTSQAHEGLDFHGLCLDPGASPQKLSHQQILGLDPAKRFAARDDSNWRMHGFYAFSAAARAIFENAELRRLASLVLDREADPSASINFTHGSAQGAHQDTAVFHIFPPNNIVGIWIACEDISPDCGPLMFYPKSHRQPLFGAFPNYPQTNLRTASPETDKAYNEYARGLEGQYERSLFIAKKGDVLFWHGMLLHGGSEIKNPALTRKSYVLHYTARGTNVEHQIVGPFNW